MFVWLFVVNDDDAPSEGGSAAGGCKDGEEMVGTKCLVKCEDGKIRVGEVRRMLKIQTMNIDTTHSVRYGTKNIELGTLMHSGVLKGIKLTAKAKEQGWGYQCSSFQLNIMRDGKSIAGINQKNGKK